MRSLHRYIHETPSTQRRLANVFLVQLPCPQCLWCIVLDIFNCSNIVLKLLLLSGDIEVNPGPTTRNTSSQADHTIHALLTKLDKGQAEILSTIKAINERLTRTEETMKDLINRITNTDETCSSILEIRTSIDVLTKSASVTANQLSHVEDRLNDAEDWSRRCNLPFYGITETQEETWAHSEKLVTDIRRNNLKIDIQTTASNWKNSSGETASNNR